MSDKAWFVRRGSGLCCSIRPTGAAGWLISGVFGAVIVLLTALAEKHPARLLVWMTLILCATLVYVVTPYRLSVPADPRK